jgi:hypothetical protein
MRTFLLKSFIFEWESKMLVSSAKIIGVEILFLGKSFIYMRNYKGPKTDPCGTPCLTLSQSDAILFISFLCVTVLIYLLLIKIHKVHGPSH